MANILDHTTGSILLDALVIAGVVGVMVLGIVLLAKKMKDE